MFVILTIAILGKADTSLTDGFSGARPDRRVHRATSRSSPASCWPGRCTHPTTRATCRRTRPPSKVFWYTLLGMSLASGWLEILGLLVAGQATGRRVERHDLPGARRLREHHRAPRDGRDRGRHRRRQRDERLHGLAVAAGRRLRIKRVYSAADRRRPRLPVHALPQRPGRLRDQLRQLPAVHQLLDRAVRRRRPGRLVAAEAPTPTSAASATSAGCRRASSGSSRWSSGSSSGSRSRTRRSATTWAGRSTTSPRTTSTARTSPTTWAGSWPRSSTSSSRASRSRPRPEARRPSPPHRPGRRSGR